MTYYNFSDPSFLDLCLYQCKITTITDNILEIGSSHYQFFAIQAETAVLNYTNSKGTACQYTLTANQAAFLFPNPSLSLYSKDSHSLDYFYLEFDGIQVKRLLNQCSSSQDMPMYVFKNSQHIKKLCNIIEQILSYQDSSIFYVLSLLYSFLDKLFTGYSDLLIQQYKSNSSMSEFYLKESISFLEQNFSKNISVEDIATVCGIHPNQLGKIFKEHFGKTPQDFLISYRMTKAARLLSLTNLSIKEIANAVGYENPFHFSRTFKRLFSVSPKHWRETKQLEYSSSQKK